MKTYGFLGCSTVTGWGPPPTSDGILGWTFGDHDGGAAIKLLAFKE